jgi:hypothetical protein
MTKYAALGIYLRSQKTSEIPMSFKDIEKIVGAKLPNSKRYPAWWSNNTSNNVMTKVWLDAGYRTERVDTEGGKLVFKRVAAMPPPEPATGMAEESRAFESAPCTGRHPMFGGLKGLLWIAPDCDLTRPALPEWEKLFDEKWAGKLG